MPVCNGEVERWRFVVGYSLPEADAAACLLRGTARLAENGWTVVDRNASDLCPRLERSTGAELVATFNELAECGNHRLSPAGSSTDFPHDLLGYGPDYRIKNGSGHVISNHGGDRSGALDRAPREAGLKK